ncbi:MAG TPA: polyprenyl synthetase family protein [Bacteroidia bacterium]|nr:polyprenyl synthetase family protein [Bacteroidia bacterium]
MDTTAFNRLISESLEKFSAQLPVQPASLYDPIRYFIANGGKRMRPLLVLYGAGIFSRDVSRAVPAATGIELFHNFTLLHDDIMDNAVMRRGKETVHVKWNTNVAILSGDALFAEAFRQVAMSPPDVLPRVLGIFSRTATEVCEGQQLDMDFENAPQVSIAGYMQMIRLKTAVLLRASLSIGALCGGAAENDAQLLGAFGEHTGLAFQLQDDILDVFGDEDKFGKVTGGDIVSNKKTFLLLKAMELANRYQREELQHWMLVPVSEAAAKVEAVKNIYNTLGVRELAEKEMQNQYAHATAALEKVNAPGENKMMLKAFSDALMVRQH